MHLSLMTIGFFLLQKKNNQRKFTAKEIILFYFSFQNTRQKNQFYTPSGGVIPISFSFTFFSKNIKNQQN